MHNLFVLLISIFSTCISLGQIDILNHSLVDATEKVLIRGLYNKLEVVGMDIDSTFHLTTNTHDTLLKSGNYTISGGGPDSILVISIEKEKRIYFTKTYNVLKYHDPKVYLGDIRDSIVSKETLLKNLFLHLSNEPLPIQLNSYVRLREAKIIKSNGKIIDLNTKREARYQKRMNALSEDEYWRKALKMQKKYERNEPDTNVVNYSFSPFQMKLIHKMKKGDILWIQICFVSCSSGVARLYGPNLKFKII